MEPPAYLGSEEKRLWEQLEPDRMPRHIAIIMDGNGRWARERGLPRVKGHKAGVRAIRKAVDTVLDLGIEAITIYAFSTENWGRPPYEVSVLMTLLRQFIGIERDRMMQKGIQLNVLGEIDQLPEPVRDAVRDVIRDTAPNQRLRFNIALNYGGRQEILRAVRRMVADGLPLEAMTEEAVSNRLYTAGLPDPDLLIRTSGELRISNFLLWQLSYTELYFTDVYWPDFDTRHMLAALLDYQRRSRRFGGVHGD